MQNSFDNQINDDKNMRGSNTKVISRTTIFSSQPDQSTSLKIDHSKDKELINSGLHRLVSNFSNANKVAGKASKTAQNKKSGNYKCQDITAEESQNDFSLPEKNVDSHIVLTKQISVDKHTMTDLDKQNECTLENASTILSEPTDENFVNSRDLQWTDPRLLKKYSLVKQPYSKSFSIPLINKSHFQYEERLNEIADEDEAEIYCDLETNFLLRILYYFCTASVMLIGSVCGITLITLILWMLVKENVIQFSLSNSAGDTFLRKYLGTVLSSFVYMVNCLMSKLARALTISAKEVFVKEEEVVAWHRNWL